MELAQAPACGCLYLFLEGQLKAHFELAPRKTTELYPACHAPATSGCSARRLNQASFEASRRHLWKFSGEKLERIEALYEAPQHS